MHAPLLRGNTTCWKYIVYSRI